MPLANTLRVQRFIWLGLRDRAFMHRVIHGMAPLPADAPTAVVPTRVVRNAMATIAAQPKSAAPPTGTFMRGIVWPWSRKGLYDPAFGQFIAQPITLPVYCGRRMVDGQGHVNNSKYLEIAEFGRLHHMAFLGIYDVLLPHNVAFVVSDLSITYQREIAPRSKVWLRTRFLLPPEAPLAKQAAAGKTTLAKVPVVPNKKRLFVEHEIWSADGQKLHAAITLAAALIGPVEYEKELQARYGSAGGPAQTATPASAKPPRPRVTLNCEQVLADAAGLATTAELRQLFASVEHVCTPISDIGEGVSTPSSTQANGNPEDEERVDRICTLTQTWRRSRDTMRHKSLVARPKKT